MLDVADRDVDHEVVAAGDIVEIADLGQRGEVRPQPLHQLALVANDADEHQGLERDRQGPGIDVGVEATDDLVPNQSTHALEAAGGRETDARGQLLVAQPRILLKRRQDSAIDSVGDPCWVVHTNLIRWSI